MKLKRKLKALAAATMLAVSGSALADINTGSASGGAGELFVSVWSNSLNLSYTRDLGINLNNFLAGGVIAPIDVAPGNGVDYAPGSTVNYAAGNVLAAGYKLVFGIDTVLANSGLLAASDAVWNVVGIRDFGTPDRLFTTSNVANPTATGAAVVQAVSKVKNFLIGTGGVNAVMPGTSTATNDSITAAPPALAYAGSSNFGPLLGSGAGWTINTAAAVGSSLAFYDFSETAGRTDYTGGYWQLDSDGGLSWNTTVAAVPVPGALILLLSGLLGLVGVSRRRGSSAVAA